MIDRSQNDILRQRQRIRERRHRAISEYYAAAAEDERLLRLDGPSGDKEMAVNVASEACVVLRTDLFDLFSRNREQHVAYARGICQYIIRKKYKWSFPRIGRVFDRDHTSVIHQCNLVEAKIDKLPGFAAMIGKICARVDARLIILSEDDDVKQSPDSEGSSEHAAGTPEHHLSAAQAPGVTSIQDRL